MAHVGFWSPLPPQPSGIADYSYSILSELAKTFDVTAVVDDEFSSVVPGKVRRRLQVPEGVAVANHATTKSNQFDCNIYQMGNNATFHSYMHDRVLEDPGLLVLHDPSLFDFYVGLCGGESSPSLREEVRLDLRTTNATIPKLRVDGNDEVDRLALLMSRRLVDASLMTVVHSDWAVDAISRRSPESIIERIYQPADVLRRPETARGFTTFGILGGINLHKRVLQALEAFAVVHREFENARLILAGRIDAPELVDSIAAWISGSGASSAVDIRYDVAADDFDRLLLECDVLIALRWPTAGETSAPMMRAFGAAMPVITTDVPQFREFDDSYCWKVPIGASAERRGLVEAMRNALQYPDTVRAAGRAAQSFVEDNATNAIAASHYARAIASCLQLRGRAVAGRRSPSVPAANAIGCWSATTGVGEAARRAVLAMSNAGVAIALTDVAIDVPTDANRIPAGIVSLPKGRPAPIDISFLNVNELHGVPDEFLRPEPGRYLVAYWYWELPDLPARLVPEVQRFDEFWVASRFVQGNLARYTTAPVVVMPSVVAPEADPLISRKEFGLPRKSCLFLFNFDVSSGLARKNPFAAIDAFSQAFSHEEGACLVMKTMNLNRWPEASYELRRRLDRVGGVIIEEHLTDAEVASLTRCCDVYVSLHRSEGFGLGMAEAMYFGVPVIATRYSGSEDFLTASNSCGVGYRMTCVDAGELRFNPGAENVYEPGMSWADPDIDQAAVWMRMLYDHQEMRQRIGAQGAETIRFRYNSEAAGCAMRCRLVNIRSGKVGRYSESEDVA